MLCCSNASCSSTSSLCDSDSHLASFTLSFTRYHQTKSQWIPGAPPMMNIQRQPKVPTRWPDRIDIHKIVTGLPRIRKVLALERSAFVNHLLKNISMEGITALSTTPSIKRMTINKVTLCTIPVAIANAPHSINDQKINFLALLFAAYKAPGIWKKK